MMAADMYFMTVAHVLATGQPHKPPSNVNTVCRFRTVAKRQAKTISTNTSTVYRWR